MIANLMDNQGVKVRQLRRVSTACGLRSSQQNEHNLRLKLLIAQIFVHLCAVLYTQCSQSYV